MVLLLVVVLVMAVEAVVTGSWSIGQTWNKWHTNETDRNLFGTCEYPGSFKSPGSCASLLLLPLELA